MDANNQSIQGRSQGLQAGLDYWWNRYLWTYFCFDDCFLRDNYYWRLPIGSELGIIWYPRRTPSTIYAMAKAIIQLCPQRFPHSPTVASLPDFQSLGPEQKEGIYKHIEEELDHAVHWCHYTFAYEALAYRATGPDLIPYRDRSYEVYREEYWVHHLPAQMLVIANVCQFQVVASHSYANFHSIDDLRQVLLNQYLERRGVSSIEPHLQKVHQHSSWEGSAPAILRCIPPDDKINELYDIYIDRNIAAPAPGDSFTGSPFNEEPHDSSTDSLFGNDDYK